MLAAAIMQVTSSTPNGSYKAGDRIAIAVEYDSAVTVSGTPILKLNCNSGGTFASYSGQSGGNTILNFQYTVVSGDTSPDLDVFSASAAMLLGTIDDPTVLGVGDDASRAFPFGVAPGSLASLKNLVIDTGVPAVPTVNPLHVNPRAWQAAGPVYFTLHPNYFTLTGTAGTSALPAGEVLTVVVNGMTFTPTVNSLGAWSCNLITATHTGVPTNPWTNVALDQYEVVATVSDLADNQSVDTTFYELTIDVAAPTIVGATSTSPSGSYTTGAVIPILVSFTEPVFIATGTGIPLPTLALNVAPSQKYATYSTGTGTSSLTFLYTVVAGDSVAALDYVILPLAQATAIVLAGGGIQDQAGNDAILTMPAIPSPGSLAGSTTIVIDTISPTVVSVSAVPAKTYFPGDIVTVQITLDSACPAINVSGPMSLALNSGAAVTATYASAIFNPTNTILNFTYTVAQGDSSSDLGYLTTSSLTLGGGAYVRDLAGNNLVLALPVPGSVNSLDGSSGIVIASLPVVLDVTSLAVNTPRPSPSKQMYYTVGETIQIDVKFDQAVDVIAPPGTPPITAIGPRIRLNASATACFANLMPGAASGTGTDTLHFLYTVAPGHVTAALNYVGSGSLTPGGYRIVHTNLQLPRHDAIRTLPAPSAPGSLDWNENLQVALDSTAASAPVIKTQAWPLPVGGLAWTGVVIASGITTNPNIQVRGLETSPILATWEFSDDTGATWTPGSPGGSQLAPVGRSTFFLDDGTYPIGSVLVRQTDPSGNVSLVGSNPIAWTITADVSVLPPVLALGTGVANGATLAEAIQATGVVTVVGELNASISVTFTGAGTVTKILTGTGVAQPVVLTSADVTTLGNGIVTVTATQTDPARNLSGSSSINFTIDTLVVNPVLALGTGVANGATLAEATQATGVVTVVGELAAIITVTFTGAGTVTKILTGTGVAQPVVLTSADVTTLGNGTITVTATQTDLTGNVSGTSSINFTIDTLVVNPVLALGTGVANGAMLTEAIQATGVVTVVGELNAGITVTFVGTTGTPVIKTLTGTGPSPSVAQPVVLTAAEVTTLGNGIVTVTATQTDPAGNVSGNSSITFTIDTLVVNPVLALGTGVADGATQAEAIQATGVVTVVGELNAIIIVSFAGALGSVTKTLTGTGVAQPVVLTAADVTTLGNGSVTVTATQTDSAGNVSGNSSINFTIDSPALNPPLFPWRQSPPSPIPNFRIPVTRIPLPFAAPLTGFSVSNLSLYLNGRLISLRGTIITGSGANYVIQLPSLATNLRGSYRLDVSGLSGMPAPYSYYFNRI